MCYEVRRLRFFEILVCAVGDRSCVTTIIAPCHCVLKDFERLNFANINFDSRRISAACFSTSTCCHLLHACDQKPKIAPPQKAAAPGKAPPPFGREQALSPSPDEVVKNQPYTPHQAPTRKTQAFPEKNGVSRKLSQQCVSSQCPRRRAVKLATVGKRVPDADIYLQKRSSSSQPTPGS